MEGLLIFLSGVIIGAIVEPRSDPKHWWKTVLWVALVIFGLVAGAARYFHIP